jgi:hypothetical protein
MARRACPPGFRFGGANPCPRPIFWSWRPTNTTATSSSPRSPYKQPAPTASTPDRFRARRVRFSVWQGKTPPPPNLPFLAFHHYHHRLLITPWILNDPRQRPPHQTNTRRVALGYWFGRAKPWSPLELAILTSHHVNPHINISLHTPSTPPAKHF